MKRKIKYIVDDIESVYNAIHNLMKINNKGQYEKLYTGFDKLMDRIDSTIYYVLFDFLVDNGYYILADRLFENCISQNIDFVSEFESESMLSCFMTYFEAKEYEKVNYYLKKGFDINVHQPWLLVFLNAKEYSEIMDYITQYNRRIKIERIKSKISIL